PQWPAEKQALPLVYVTFGTMYNQDVGVLGHVVAGLRGLPVRLIVTVGPSGDPCALGPQPPNVHVARYIPQSKVLGSASAVVSHAGSGTFLAALAHGLPQLCLPQGADQFGNARACSSAGAGLEIPPRDISADRVRAATNHLLVEPDFRARARQLADEIAQMPTPNTVAEQIRITYQS
ncbi:MAG TPA: nucleotide disphospho-sugar-binding domain-containing protein, partial [Acidimicrobiales bacterium]|nr:nucleotide disphospho-sugar-binding domain-containing protein [Acidimicrobiales bacterium]